MVKNASLGGGRQSRISKKKPLNQTHSVASSRAMGKGLVDLTSKTIGPVLRSAFNKNPALEDPKGYATLGKEIVMEFDTEEDVEDWINVEAIDGGVLGQISFRNPKTATSQALLVKKTSLTETETIIASVRAQYPGVSFKLYQVYEDSTGRGRLAGVRDWVVEFSEPQREIVKQLIMI